MLRVSGEVGVGDCLLQRLLIVRRQRRQRPFPSKRFRVMSQLLAGLVLLLLSLVGASLGLVSGQGVLGGLGTCVHFFTVDSAGCLCSLLLALIDVLSPVQAIILQLHQVHLYELVEILLRGSLGFVTAVTLLIFLQIHTDDYFLLLLH